MIKYSLVASDKSGTLYHGTFTSLAALIAYLDDGWTKVVITKIEQE